MDNMWQTFFDSEISSLEENGLLRRLIAFPKTGSETLIDGRTVLNFSSNDYLGLANDRRLKEAGIKAIEEYGSGATASRLLAGHLNLHENLEKALAHMMETESALVFGSGFLTNVGIISAIVRPGDEVFSDWLNHASIIDGIRLSRANSYRYRHKDLDHLESLLRKRRKTGKAVVISESLFSMDGDVAPVRDLVALAERFDALSIIDEAHAIGVMGKNGGGVCRASGSGCRPDIVVGTLSKALGGYGGFVACPESIRNFLVNRARTFLYSTGLPPACLGSAMAAVSIVESEPELGRQLLDKAAWFCKLLVKAGLQVSSSGSQILPVIIGTNSKVIAFSKLLIERGLLIRPIRPPTVPVGTARVRLSVTLSMSKQSLQRASDVIVDSAREIDII
jgi:8-amino-7-oxononanoate synthase